MVRFEQKLHNRICFMNYSSYSLNNISNSMSLFGTNELLDKIPSNSGLYFELPKEWLESGPDDLSSKPNSKSVVNLLEKLSTK